MDRGEDESDLRGVRRVLPEEYAGEPALTLADVVAACHAFDGRDPLDEAAHLRLRNHGLDGAALWLAPGGFALLHPAGGATALELAVAPQRRQEGTGRALAAAALATARGEVVTWSHGDHPGAAALAAELGFDRTRELRVLQRRTTSEDARWPGDLRIRPYRPSDRDELLRVNAVAFADHPEQGAMDAANLAERMAESWYHPAGLLVAEDPDVSGRLTGFHWTKIHPHGEGEVYVLAVDPAAQGTGVGSALSRAGLAHLAERGCPSVHLYVEATNRAALGLYEGLGFAPDHVHAQYRRG